jgi:FkbM family methyltransferase
MIRAGEQFLDSGGRACPVCKIATPDGHSFGIVCDGLAESRDGADPVAESYRSASLDPVAIPSLVALAALAEGDRVLDLGTHLGGFALAAAAMGFEVLALEASPWHSSLLQLSACYNGFDHLQVCHAAVGDENGVVEFSCHGPWGHVSTPVTGMPSVTVPLVRVDDLLAQRKWGDVRMVKLDVEGSEIQAIRGMRAMLSGRDAPLLYFESNRHTLAFYGHSDEDLQREVRSLGYDVYEIVGNHLRPTPAGCRQDQQVVDYLAAKRLPAGLDAWLVPPD